MMLENISRYKEKKEIKRGFLKVEYEKLMLALYWFHVAGLSFCKSYIKTYI